jgi:hypothetical protein
VAVTAAVGASLLAALPLARPLVPREPCRVWPGALAAEPPGPRLDLPYAPAGMQPLGDRRALTSTAEAVILDECGRGRLGADARGVPDGVDVLWSYGGLGSSRLTAMFRALPDPDATAVLARRLSATHVSLPPPPGPMERELYEAATRGASLVRVDPEYGLALFAVPHAPWARFAPRVVAVCDPDEAERAFVGALRDPADSVVVESERPVPSGAGRVLSVARERERVAVEVEALAEGLLVVNDALWPGWIAGVDGREAPILAVDLVARGVVVPAGRHAVTMAYEPPEVRAGIVLSLLGLAACGALVGLEAHRRRATSPGAAGAARLTGG